MRRIAAKDRIGFWATVFLAVVGYGLAMYLWRYPPSPPTPRIVLQDRAGRCHDGGIVRAPVIPCPR